MIMIIMYESDQIDSNYHYLFLGILDRGIEVSNKASHLITIIIQQPF